MNFNGGDVRAADSDAACLIELRLLTIMIGPVHTGFKFHLLLAPDYESVLSSCGGYRHYGRAASYSPGRPWSLDGAALANKVNEV